MVLDLASGRSSLRAATHKDVLDATGFFDDRRRKQLTLAQDKPKYPG
jgi:hypothetical protein